jgi:hypothetical protein
MGRKTCLPLAEKCHGYIYIPGSTARGLAALGKGSKIGYLLPQWGRAFGSVKNIRIANEVRHIWRKHARDAIAATAGNLTTGYPPVSGSFNPKTKPPAPSARFCKFTD